MYAAGANIIDLLGSNTSGEAGAGPMMMQIVAQIDLVHGDLDNLNTEMSNATNVVKGHLDVELGAIHAAFHDAWVPALNKVRSATQDKDGNKYDFAKGLNLGVSTSQDKIRDIFKTAGSNQQTVKALHAPRITDPAHAADQREEELKAAESAALVAGMSSVETAVDLVKADLHSSVADQSKEALDLTVSVEQLVAVFEPISPDHIGKMTKLPIVVKQVQDLQAEIMKMRDAGDKKGQALAPKLGYNTPLSTNLHKLKTKMSAVKTVNKSTAKHR
jgi:hypothetical protein